MPTWGAIADDVTGATDLASNFVERGISAMVLLGRDALTPATAAEIVDSRVRAVVVALRSRTAPVRQAVEDSSAALHFLEGLSTDRYYIKYCSTFDSTREGNIGPVIDRILALRDRTLTVAVPSFPDNGRTLYQGHLFVGDRLLSESPMRFHPLTPMTDSDIVRHLAAQSTSRVVLIPLVTVRAGEAAIRAELGRFEALGERAIVVVDAVDDDDLTRIAAATADLEVVTGGSGLALGLDVDAVGGDPRRIDVVPGRRAILSGSASRRTCEQVQAGKRVHPWRKLSPDTVLREPHREIEEVLEWADTAWEADPGAAPLVFSTDDASDITDEQGLSEAFERVLAEIADGFVARGVRRLIVAGGETSGRVGERLGIISLRIGPAVGPGVAWSLARTAGGGPLNIALKSGNFGAPGFFIDAWAALESQGEQ